MRAMVGRRTRRNRESPRLPAVGGLLAAAWLACAGPFHIGNLHDPRVRDAGRHLSIFRNELLSISGQTLRGRRLELIELQLSDSVDFAALIERRIVSVTAVEAYVEAGLSVAVVPWSGKVGITINLPASRQEGSDWDAALLSLARILR